MRLPFLAALAAFVLPHAAEAGELRFCFEEWAPFHTIEKGKPAGIQIELNDRALAALGHTAVYELRPYLDCVNAVNEGSFDAMLLTSGEEPLVPATVSTVFWEIGLLARPDWEPDGFAELSDFDGKAMGMVRGYVYPEAVEVAKAGWKVAITDDDALNLRRVASGKLDATVIDIPWALRLAKQEGLKVKALTPRLSLDPQYTYFNPRHAGLAVKLGAELRRLIDDGTVDAIYLRETGESFRDVQARARQTLLD